MTEKALNPLRLFSRYVPVCRGYASQLGQMSKFRQKLDSKKFMKMTSHTYFCNNPETCLTIVKLHEVIPFLADFSHLEPLWALSATIGK